MQIQDCASGEKLETLVTGKYVQTVPDKDAEVYLTTKESALKV